MIDAWIIVQEQRYTNDGLGGEPMLRVTHEAVHFSGGPCKFGRGLEVIGIFETEKVANDYIAYLDQNGVLLFQRCDNFQMPIRPSRVCRIFDRPDPAGTLNSPSAKSTWPAG